MKAGEWRGRIAVGMAASLTELERRIGRHVGNPPAVGPYLIDLQPEAFPPYIPIPPTGFRLSGKHLVRYSPEWSAGLNHYIWHGPCDGLHVSNCVIEGGAKWASRSYRMRSMNVVEFTAFLGTYPEHDLYWNIAGFGGSPALDGRFAALFRGLYFERTAGQNIQLVQVGDNRRFEEGFDAVAAGDWSHGGPIVLVDILSRDAGYLQDGPHVRSSYALSFFETDNPVYLRRVFVDKTMQPQSRGCLLLEGHKRVAVRDSVFLAKNAVQSLVNVQRCEEVTFDSCVIEADEGQNWVDITGPSRVTFRNCLGSAEIHANRKTIGTVSKGGTFEIAG